MAVTLSFTPNLYRHVDCPDAAVTGTNVREILDAYFRSNPKVRGYVLDDQGALRTHVAIFLNEAPIRDRVGLADSVANGDSLFVVQALSGG